MLPQKLGSESEQLGGAVQMKRHGNLWDKICDYDNILAAHHAARKGKSHYKEVKMINKNEEFYIKRLQETLLKKSFTTSPYEIFDRFDGRKIRKLYKLPYYPDRIVQHALLQIIGPIFTKSFIRDTFQSIPGRGTHDARKRVQKCIQNKEPRYALKFDIEKFYPNVNNELLKKIIRRKIKCKETLWLIDNIIDSSKGIPIGNYTSQYFGNIYLYAFDWWVVQNLKPFAYFRYCDDVVLVTNDSKEAHRMKTEIFEKLKTEYELSINRNWQVFPIEIRGLDFVGFVTRSNSIRLRKNISKSFKVRAKRKISDKLYSYWGWCKHVNAKKLWFKYTKSLLPIR